VRRHVDVGETRLAVLDYPDYDVAHPGEEAIGQCTGCLLAVRPDTGEIVLLWGIWYGGTHVKWSVSRSDPNYARHRIDLMGVYTP
jgi:hypothetical protein